MLLDMDAKPELSHEEQGWVKDLTEVLYKAEDLLDKVITTAKMKELNNGDGDDSDEFFKKVFDEVGGVSSIEELHGGQLKDLKSLVNLRGKIDISIHGNLASENGNVCEESENYYLKHIKNLKVVTIWRFSQDVTNEEALIAKLQPTEYLTQFKLVLYDGSEIPRWGRAHDDWAIILPNLVNIELWHCNKLDGIPLLSNLKCLKSLTLSGENLEYMEISGSFGPVDISFFPSLEYLQIYHANKLKGWRGEVGVTDSYSSKSHWLPPFPHLLTLKIDRCPELTSFPPCPSLKSLEVIKSKNLLGRSPGEGHGNLDISNCSSLQSLEIFECTRMTSVLGALKHLTALKSLSLGDGDVEVEFNNDMPWRSLHLNLRSLELKSLDTLQILPEGMKHLTALENLIIKSCKSLEELPEWISCLSSLHSLTIESCSNLKSLGTIQYITSLQKLEIKSCPELKEACQEPSGREWPNIRHIPHIYLRSW